MRRLPRFSCGLQLPLLRKKSKPENSDFYKAAPAFRRCGFCKRLAKQACATRSVAHLYTLCVYRQGGGVSTPFLSYFFKSREMFPSGNAQRRLGRREKPRSGRGLLRKQQGFNWIVRNCCLCALIRGLQNLGTPCKGGRDVTFCVVQKVTQKAHGTSSCDLGSNRRSIRWFG